ncbi:MAG TPA: glycoside hydrolase family 2 TIM barrel-domain containing protein [Candidatus Limnocylindria bacterium]|nr:glycoside hydrolase family 2 TIM barrel-domain containing protein [Candidatus Limnocylindria bacterium]
MTPIQRLRARRFFYLTTFLAATATGFAAAEWKPAAGPLMTRWAKDVSPKKPLNEYPRPQFVREDWQNLNGLWDYAITAKDAPTPTQWQGNILVPFPIESALSGVMTNVSENQRLWYLRKFEIPRGWRGKRVLLNFGAVDWETAVWINGKEFGKHQGGYDAFSLDITDALKAKGENEIIVSVWDPTDTGPQPRGKQVRKPGGIWYTPVSGIWQTVWLEPVSEIRIERLQITPNLDQESVTIETIFLPAPMITELRAEVTDGWRTIAEGTLKYEQPVGIHGSVRGTISLRIPRPKAWSPESPHLYKLKLELKRIGKTGKKVDEVESYFGVRKISMARDDKGRLRMQLNNTNYFQLGPLDQGWWPDGLYTAPTDEALRYDVEMTKKLGFNMARKHVKVEPARWYYWCDKLGLLVWQDLPSGDKSARWKGPSGYDGEEMKRTPESTAIYERELKAMIDGLYNVPSIVVWVPFNEGWGQFDTVRILNLTKRLDPTRLVDGPSGGNHFPAGDIIDHHQYPGPGAPAAVTDRAMVLGEFGGLGLPIKGRTWQSEKNWGYRSFTNSEALTKNYVGLIRKLQPMIEQHGLSAAIYTQTTDVEVEVNGLMTYDRAIVKMPIETVAKANRFQFPPEPTQKVLSPTAAQHIGATWRYTTEKPSVDWLKPEFDASSWKEGRAGFGTPGTPGSIIGTEWKTTDIWLRREVDVKGNPRELKVMMNHDEDAEVYINGVLAVKAARHIGEYQEFDVAPGAVNSLREGKNVIAVHCHQTTGGQYIDVGVIELEPMRQ